LPDAKKILTRRLTHSDPVRNGVARMGTRRGETHGGAVEDGINVAATCATKGSHCMVGLYPTEERFIDYW
jgi:hypothetical protein